MSESRIHIEITRGLPWVNDEEYPDPVVLLWVVVTLTLLSPILMALNSVYLHIPITLIFLAHTFVWFIGLDSYFRVTYLAIYSTSSIWWLKSSLKFSMTKTSSNVHPPTHTYFISIYLNKLPYFGAFYWLSQEFWSYLDPFTFLIPLE